MRINLKKKILSTVLMPMSLLTIAPFLSTTISSCSNKEQQHIYSGTMYAHIEEASEMTYYVRSTIGNIPDLWYSLDKGVTWTQLIPTQETDIEYQVKVSIPENSTVYFKGNNPDGWCKHMYDEATISFNAHFSVGGNVMSLLDNGKGNLRKIPNPYCFRCLFNTATRLVAVDKDFLPATELQEGCYQALFKDCHILIAPPTLPARICASYCYHRMFMACESLTKLPALPAMKLAPFCYKEMFWSCVKLPSLARENMLPAKEMEVGCYERMFQQCVSLGRLIIPSLLPATKLADRCYYGMFGDCENLSVVPSLPATELADDCYAFMFDDCNRLIDLSKSLHLNATILKPRCYSNMFLDCKNLEIGPTIMEATTAEQCYEEMFLGCESLNQITVHFHQWDDNTTNNWVGSDDHIFSPSGTFRCPHDLPQDYGPSYIPDGWEIEILDE